MVFFPKLDSNSLVASVTFPDGTPESVTDRWTEHLEKTFWEVDRELQSEGGRVGVRSTVSLVRKSSPEGGRGGREASAGWATKEVSRSRWSMPRRGPSRATRSSPAGEREAGRIPGTESLSFGAQAHGPGGAAIEFKLTAQSTESAIWMMPSIRSKKTGAIPRRVRCFG